MKWFKFYGQDWLTDLKIMKMSVEDRLCFITLLCLASSSGERGVIRGCDEEALIQLTHLYEDPYEESNQVSRARGCLKRYEALQIVTLADNGDVTVRNFERRQGENLSNAERQQKYRERLKTTVKPRNERNATPRNDSNARIDKNRIDKNRDIREGSAHSPTPAEIAKSFFEKGSVYSNFLVEFSEKLADIITPSSIEVEFEKFVLYWTEPNKTGRKVRWEQQPTFEVKRRLYTWLSRNRQYEKKEKFSGRGLA